MNFITEISLIIIIIITCAMLC